MKTLNVLPAVLLSTALPCAAAMPECINEAHQLQMALIQHPPVDPRVMNDVLTLRHKALGLCQRGAGAEGRGLLQHALSLATPPGLAGTGLSGSASTNAPAGAGRRP